MHSEIGNLLPSEVLQVKSTFPVLKSNRFTVVSPEALASLSPLGLHRIQLIDARGYIQTLNLCLNRPIFLHESTT